jgi:tetratricopeptide (TPR) repeat protein
VSLVLSSLNKKGRLRFHCFAALVALVTNTSIVALNRPASAHPAYQLFPEEEAPVETLPVKVTKKVRHKKPVKIISSGPAVEKANTGRTSSKVASIESEPTLDPVGNAVTGSAAGSRIKSMNGGFDTTLSQIPHDSQGYFKRAEAEARAREYKAAISDCELAIKMNPKYTEAFYLRGITRLATGDYSGALNDLDKVVIRDDNYREVFYKRGEVREKQGDMHGAQVDWQMALKKAQERGDRTLQTKIKAKLKATI